MKASWSKRALSQLRAAHAYIETENPRADLEFVEAIESPVDLLGRYPGMGAKTNEPRVIMFPLVRYRYLVFYKILRGDEVRIIRIRHALRRRPKSARAPN
jgi:plasmid stabilization system protein ParE